MDIVEIAKPDQCAKASPPIISKGYFVNGVPRIEPGSLTPTHRVQQGPSCVTLYIYSFPFL